MAWKQLSDFDKGQIVASNDCRLSLHIAKKLNYHHSSIEVSSKIRKLQIIIKKRSLWFQEKNHYTFNEENIHNNN